MMSFISLCSPKTPHIRLISDFKLMQDECVNEC